ncbi:MAG: beta-lactamase family protein [Acidobacteria bacterium]|nr:beta-lactamase family protein [Acidobacteriota bacterium]
MNVRNILLVAASLLSLFSCTTSDIAIMSWEEYGRLQVEWPYVVTFASEEGGELLYFGAAHTYDPGDYQLIRIEQAWETFDPDIAFTEGGSPPLERFRDEAIRKYGEPGFVRYLAARDDVPTTTLDPPRAEEVAALASRFTKEQVKMFFILRAVSQFVERNRAEGIEREVERILEIYDDISGLRGPPRTATAVEKAYARLFPGQGSYHTVPSSWFDPTERQSLFNDISRAGSEYRDRYVVERLVNHVREGRRVFAVVGGSHVVMQEPALRRQLRATTHEWAVPSLIVPVATESGVGPESASTKKNILLAGDTLETVEELLTEKMAAAQIPGLSAAIVVDGQLAWSGAYGVADLENDVLATPTTVYRTASIGKAMTATAVMQLAERGRIDLDAPVQTYCPTFPVKRWPVTVRHLLGHTSGIRHYGGLNEEAELFNTTHYDSVAESLEIFSDDPLLFEPGTAHHYSTFGYNVLGCVIEGATGTEYLEYMRSRIFEPAGTRDTRDDDPSAIIPGRSAGYRLAEDGTLRNSRPVDMSSKLPAGGFVTTAEDLARFAAAVMNHELIAEETLDQMLEPVRLRNGEIVEYGFGWGLFPGETWYGEREAFHGGVTPQVSGMLYLLPDRKFAVAILTNLEGVPGRTALAAEIAKVVLGLGEEREKS